MNDNITLSIIIPTRNRVKLLNRTLDSLVNQNLSHNVFEVIIIDNGSTDNTRETVEAFHGKIKNLRYFYEKEPGLHTGRHKGLKEARADILVYGDDDIKAFPSWLEGIKESFHDDKVVLVGGKNLPEYEADPPDWLIEMWNKNQKTLGYLSILDLGDEVKEISPYYVWGCNFSIRKSTLLEAGGFHPDGMPQELIKYRGDGESYVSEYILKKGYKIIYNPKASIYHFVPRERMTQDYFEKRAFNQGVSDSYTQIRNKVKVSNYYKNVGLLSILKKVKSKIKRIINIKKEKNIVKGVKEETELDRIERVLLIKYKEGFDYHQNEIKNDSELLKWVLKDYYW